MFKCQVSGKLSSPGEKSFKLISKTRKKEYFKNDAKTGQPIKIGEGFEIVEELTVCEDVYRASTSGSQAN